jgi:hypothetical protein
MISPPAKRFSQNREGPPKHSRISIDSSDQVDHVVDPSPDLSPLLSDQPDGDAQGSLRLSGLISSRRSDTAVRMHLLYARHCGGIHW